MISKLSTIAKSQIKPITRYSILAYQKMPSHQLLNKPAPTDLTLRNQDGVEVELSTFIGKQPAIVFFYPKDETLGCTKEVAKHIRILKLCALSMLFSHLSSSLSNSGLFIS